jgi:hypothetical protein
MIGARNEAHVRLVRKILQAGKASHALSSDVRRALLSGATTAQVSLDQELGKQTLSRAHYQRQKDAAAVMAEVL